MPALKTLCLFLGGSHLYKMNTPASDIDERGVFLHQDPLEVYAFNKKRMDSIVEQSPERDLSMWEFTQFLYLCTKSNTQALEVLFAPREAFTTLHPAFRIHVLDQRMRFLDSEVLFKSLCGYLQNERRLALGERTGQLGGKRKAALDEHGFSPKNFAHMMRLAFCGKYFFEKGEYPVAFGEVSQEGSDLHAYCMSIKCDPASQDLQRMIATADELEAEMRQAYEARTQNFKPDLRYVGVVLDELYANRYSR